MYTKYEEKTFEQYFNTELAEQTSVYFPLGQVQESILGLDAVAYSESPSFFRLLGPLALSAKGTKLIDLASHMETLLQKEIQGIPDIKVNLLFQYKRPEYITRKSGAEWHLWNKKYFRYSLYEEQHNLLKELESNFGEQALVLYAAPAVVDVEELVNLKLNKAVIKYTNFRKASELNGHHRNTYIEAGTYSQACSDPQRLENFDLLELIQQQARELQVKEKRDNFLFVKKVAEASLENVSAFRNAYETRMEDFRSLSEFELFHSVITMSVFKEITGIQWILALSGRNKSA